MLNLFSGPGHSLDPLGSNSGSLVPGYGLGMFTPHFFFMNLAFLFENKVIYLFKTLAAGPLGLPIKDTRVDGLMALKSVPPFSDPVFQPRPLKFRKNRTVAGSSPETHPSHLFCPCPSRFSSLAFPGPHLTLPSPGQACD